MLPTITIIVGAAAILTRLPLLLFTERTRAKYATFVSMQPLMSIQGLLMIAAGVLIGYSSTRLDLPLEWVMWIVGALMFVFGVIYVIAPQVPRQLWDSLVTPRSTRTLRVLTGIGTAIGLFILILGVSWLDQVPREAPPQAPRLAGMPTQKQIDTLNDYLAELSKTAQENSEQLEELQGAISPQIPKRIAELEQSVKDNSDRISSLQESLAQIGKQLQQFRASPGEATVAP